MVSDRVYRCLKDLTFHAPDGEEHLVFSRGGLYREVGKSMGMVMFYGNLDVKCPVPHDVLEGNFKEETGD